MKIYTEKWRPRRVKFRVKIALFLVRLFPGKQGKKVAIWYCYEKGWLSSGDVERAFTDNGIHGSEV